MRESPESLSEESIEGALRSDLGREGLPRGGQLRALLPGAAGTVVLPLKHTDVRAEVSVFVSSVSVRQEYHNPYPEKIEAVYVFPLPADAAVRDFILKVGDREIRGIIREREEARRIYLEARSQGYVASLLTEERPNIFTQSVANIEPGKSIDVEMTYFHTLPYKDGAYELVFPMVVGPRYNPAGFTEGIGAVGAGAGARTLAVETAAEGAEEPSIGPGGSGQSTEVEYLPPGTIGSHDIALEVAIDAGTPIVSISSPTHDVDVERPAEGRALVRLSPSDRIPNRDFVLRYEVAQADVGTALAFGEDAAGSYFALAVHPPEGMDEGPSPPREMVFVLDCSGSMEGEPIERARAVARSALGRLRPSDTFRVIRFSNEATSLGPLPLAATPENVARGIAYVDGLSSGGGTEMLRGIQAALDFPHDPARFRIVAFLTDGYVGNDRQILEDVSRRVGASRVFSFGVGTSVNRYLLEGLARLGRGAVAYSGLGRDREEDLEVVDGFLRRLERPAMTDIEVDWGDLRATEVYPSRVPDLFAGRPVTLVGRFEGRVPGSTVRVRGRIGGRPHEIVVPLGRGAGGPGGGGGFRHDALGSVWARAKIGDLHDRALLSPHGWELEGEIKRVALEHGILCAYTAFVAVDSLTRTSGDHGTSVKVPVNMPRGVRYETTVSD